MQMRKHREAGSYGKSYISARWRAGRPGPEASGRWLLLDSNRESQPRRGQARSTLGPRGGQHSLSSSPSSRIQLSLRKGLWGSYTPRWGSPAFSLALLFSVPHRGSFSLQPIVHSPCLHSWPPPQAGLSNPRRSPVTGLGAKSLFAKSS